MLYSFKLNTPPLESHTPFKVVDGERVFTYYAGTDTTEHFYCNLLVENKPDIQFPVTHTVEELAWGEDSYFTPEQIELNKNLVHENGVNFRLTVSGKPQRAIIGCPEYSGDFGKTAPYPVLGVEKFSLDNTLYITFQDPYFSHGSYFLSDNQGNDPLPKAVQVIKDNLAKYGVAESAATFIGASKGGNIAALMSQYFTGNQLIVCSYATDLDFWIRDSGMTHIGQTLDFLGVKIPDSLALLGSEAESKETHWYYARYDARASQGNERTFEANHLTKHMCHTGHS